MKSFVWCSIVSIVDVEADGAGDGEAQVGDDGEHVHPGGPVIVLQESSCSLNQIATRLSYYNVTTKLVDLVGLRWFKQNLAQKIC